MIGVEMNPFFAELSEQFIADWAWAEKIWPAPGRRSGPALGSAVRPP